MKLEWTLGFLKEIFFYFNATMNSVVYQEKFIEFASFELNGFGKTSKWQ